MRVGSRVGGVHVGAGLRWGLVTWFPVWVDAGGGSRRLLAPRGARPLEFREYDTPQVGQLEVTNPSDGPTLLVHGETVRGGWQDRTCCATVFVPPRAAIGVPVACVEQGRWGQGTQELEQADYTPPRLRARITEARTGSCSEVARERGQRGAWAEIDRLQHGHHRLSPTSSYHDLHDGRPRPSHPSRPPRLLAGQRGVALGYGGAIRSVELFGSRGDLATVWRRLLGATHVEAELAPAARVPANRARRAVAALERLDFQATSSVGLGEDLLASSTTLVAAGLEHEQRLLHLAAFAPDLAGV